MNELLSHKNFMPKTALGKWSLGLIVAMPILFFLGASFADSIYNNVESGRTMLQDIVRRPVLALSMWAAFFCGISAFITGILAIFKKGERSILVFCSTFIGTLLILFLASEIAFPH